MRAYFDRFNLDIREEDARYASHAGNCDQEVSEVANRASVARQLARIDPLLIVEELEEYGAWDETELADHAANKLRIVWLACGNIVEETVTPKGGDHA